MQPVNDQKLLFFIQTHGFFFPSLFANSYRKPFLEIITTVEHFGK